MHTPNGFQKNPTTIRDSPSLYHAQFATSFPPTPPLADNYTAINSTNGPITTHNIPNNPYAALPPLIPSVATYFPSASATTVPHVSDTPSTSLHLQSEPHDPQLNAATPIVPLSSTSSVPHIPHLQQPQSMFAGYYQPPNRLWQEDVDPTTPHTTTGPNTSTTRYNDASGKDTCGLLSPGSVDAGLEGGVEMVSVITADGTTVLDVDDQPYASANTYTSTNTTTDGALSVTTASFPYPVSTPICTNNALPNAGNRHTGMSTTVAAIPSASPPVHPLAAYSLAQWLSAKAETGQLQRYVAAAATYTSPSSRRWLLLLSVCVAATSFFCGGVMSVGGWRGVWTGHGPLVYGEAGVWACGLLSLLACVLCLATNVYNYGWPLACVCVAVCCACIQSGMAVARVWHLPHLLTSNIVYVIGVALLLLTSVLLGVSLCVCVVLFTRRSFTPAAVQKYTHTHIAELTSCDAETAEYVIFSDVNLLVLELLRLQQSHRALALQVSEKEEQGLSKALSGRRGGSNGANAGVGIGISGDGGGAHSLLCNTGRCGHACAAQLKLEVASLRASLQRCARERDVAQREIQVLRERGGAQREPHGMQVEQRKLAERGKGDEGAEQADADAAVVPAPLPRDIAALQREVSWLSRENGQLQQQVTQTLDLLVQERSKGADMAAAMVKQGEDVERCEREVADVRRELEVSCVLLGRRTEEVERMQREIREVERRWDAEREKLSSLGIPLPAFSESGLSHAVDSDDIANVGVIGQLREENATLYARISELEKQVQQLRADLAQSGVRVRALQGDMVRFARETERVSDSVEKQVRGIKQKM